MTTYTRIDGVHYEVTIAGDLSVRVAVASAGRMFRPLGQGRWNGRRLVGFSASIPAEIRVAIEEAIRRSGVGA